MPVRILIIVSSCVLMFLLGCQPTPKTAGEKLDMSTAVDRALSHFRSDSKASKFFADAYGWAVFPQVTRGAVLLGASNGRGEVYRAGQKVGYATVTSVTVGAQVGGQTYAEIVFFQNKKAFTTFTSNQLTGQASAGAVAGDQGELDVADYSRGVAIFTANNSGLIVAADIGGQKFMYEPMD